MKVECQVVTTPSSDTAGTLILLHLDARRYLLGHVGEGAQRALLHRRIRTSRINDFLLSGRTDWKTCGGLLGMILTLADQEAAKQADYETKRKEALRRQQEMPAGTYKLGATPAVPEPLDKKALNVHGGDNLMHKLGTTRAFIFRTNMQINVNEVKNDFADEYLHVHPMKIYPGDYDAIAQGSGATTTPDGDLTAFSLDGSARKRSFDEFRAPRNRTEILASVVSDMFNSSWTMDTMIDEPVDAEPSKDGPSSPYSPPSSPTKRMAPSHETTTPTEPQATRKVRAPWPAAAVKQLPRSKPSPASISYYISLHPQRGRFLPNKAKELGVAPGPEFRKLTEGKSVTTTGGRVVTPEECMEPPKPGKKILVLDLPEKSYIAPALARPELQEDFEATVFWILGEEVATDERLYEKMKDWPAANVSIHTPKKISHTKRKSGLTALPAYRLLPRHLPQRHYLSRRRKSMYSPQHAPPRPLPPPILPLHSSNHTTRRNKSHHSQATTGLPNRAQFRSHGTSYRDGEGWSLRL